VNVNLMLGQIGNGAGALLQMSGSNGGQDQGTETGSFAELIAALQVPATKTPNQVQGQGNTGDPPMTALEQLVQQLGKVPDRQQNASLILTQMVKELTSEAAVNAVQGQGNAGETPMTAIAQLLQQLSEMSDQQQNASLIFTQIARELTNEATVSQAEGQAESGEQEEKALNLARLFNEVGHALGETGIADFYLGQTGAFRQKDPQLPIRELTKTLKSDLGLAGIVKDLLAKIVIKQQGQGRTEEQSRKIVTPLLQQLKQTSGEQPDKNLGFGQAGGMEDVATTTFPVDSPDGQDIAELLAILLSSPDEAKSKPNTVAGKQLQSEFVELLQQLRGTGVQQPVSHLAHDKKVVQSSTHQPVKAELTELLQQLGEIKAQQVDGKAKDILGAFSLLLTQIAENLQDLGPTQLALGNNKQLTDDVLRQVSHQLSLGEGNETVNRLLQFLSTNRRQELIPTRQIVKLVEALVNQTAGDRDAAGKNGLTEPRQSSDSAKNGILKLVNTSEGINHRGQTLGKNDLQAENQQSILSVGKGVEDNQQLSQQLRHALETLGLSKEQTKQYLHVVNRLNQGLQVKSQDLTRLVGDIVMHADGLLKELSVGTDKIKNLISNFMPEKVDYPRTKMTSSKQPSDNLPGAQKAAVSKDAGHNNANSSNDQEENTKQLASGKEMTIASVHQKGNSGTDFSKVFNQTRSQEMGESVFKQIVEKTQLISTEGKQEIQIKLKPQHLGQLSLKVEQTDAGLVAKIAVESHKVQELVKEYLPRLKETLQAQGIKIGQMNVTVQDEGNQQQSQLFQFQQQQRFNRGKQWGYGGRNSSSEVVDGQSVDDRRNTDQLVDYLA